MAGMLLSAGLLTLIFIWAFSFSRSCKRLFNISIVLLIWPVAIYSALKEPGVKIQLMGVGVDNAAYDTVAFIKNNRKLVTLPRETKVYLGFIERDRIFRIKTQNPNVVRVEPFEIGKFSFSYPIKGISFAMLIVEDPTLKNGISIDPDHIAYTWNEWKKMSWWPADSANTKSDNSRIEKALKNLDTCINSHLKDRKYSACFSGE